MNRDIHLVGFDIDETVLNSKGILTPRVAASVEGSIARGITVLPATGRQLTTIPQEILALQGLRYALTANGARVHDLATGAIIFSDCFSTQTALAILSVVRTLHATYAIFIDGTAYTEGRDASFLAGIVPPHILTYLQTSRTHVPDLANTIQHATSPVEKFSIHFPTQADRAQARALLQARDDATVTSSLSMNLEINTRTANKGAALLALASQLGFSRRQVMAIGDGLNDIEMLKAVGCGVAMANAAENIRAAADTTTLSCDEDGVAVVLESLWPSA